MQNNRFADDLFIISADFKYAVKPNTRTERLRTDLVRLGLSFSECEGSYNGEKEKSFIVRDTSKMTVHHLADIYTQECFLRLSPYRQNMHKAYFINTETGEETFAGYFRSVPEDFVTRSKCDYTKDANGTYFIISLSDIVMGEAVA